MADAVEETAQEVAKKTFVVTMISTVLFVGAVFLFVL